MTKIKDRKKYILIPIQTKKGIIHRWINKNNKKFYDYDRHLKAYIKKSEIEIQKIKFVISTKKKEKKVSKRVKKVIKKRKEKIIKEKEKEPVKKVKKCKFNYKIYYSGINFDGYVRLKECNLEIDIDTTEKELNKMEKFIHNFVENEYYKLPCLQRISYVRLHYRVQTSNNLDDIRNSSNTTHVCYGISDLLRDTERIFIIIVNLRDSYRKVVIHKIEFVNYEFNSVLYGDKK